MATNTAEFGQMSDSALVAEVARLAGRERAATAELIASLVEFDQRRLYLPEGFSSLFAYCTQRLRLSEHAAYHRIEAARAARRFPVILALLEEGALTLTAVGLLAPHLTDENHREALDAARHLGKRAVEELVARLHARPDVKSSVRKLPTAAGISFGGPAESGQRRAELAESPVQPKLRPSEPGGDVAPGGDSGAAATIADCGGTMGAHAALAHRPALVRALAAARYQVQMTVSAETHAKLRYAQDLLRHAVPNGDPAAIFDRALTLLISDLERTKFAAKTGRRAKPPTEGGGAARKPKPKCHAERAANQPQPVSDRPASEPTQGAGLAVRQGPPGDGQSARQAAPSHGEGQSGGKVVPPRGVGQSGGQAAPSRCNQAPRVRSRRIPSAVKREVWTRDGGQCTFVGAAGRCTARGFLEYHHRVPYAADGPATVDNLVLTCRAHNHYEAEQFFGAETVAARRSSGMQRQDAFSQAGQLGPDRVGDG